MFDSSILRLRRVEEKNCSQLYPACSFSAGFIANYSDPASLTHQRTQPQISVEKSASVGS